MNFLNKAVSFFTKAASGEGALKMSAEKHAQHTNYHRGIDTANGIYGDILEDLSPKDDTPGVLTYPELCFRVTERLGARTAGN